MRRWVAVWGTNTAWRLPEYMPTIIAGLPMGAEGLSKQIVCLVEHAL